MKTKILLKPLLVILSAATFTMYSCSKDGKDPVIQERDLSQEIKFLDVNRRIEKMVMGRDKIIILTFREFGRESRECKGLGICGAKWFPQFEKSTPVPQPPGGGASILEFDPLTGSYFVDLLLDAAPPADLSESELIFGIDSKIELDTDSILGQNLYFKPGEYPFNPALGVYGGYRIRLY